MMKMVMTLITMARW